MMLKVNNAVQLLNKTKRTKHTVTKMKFEPMLIPMARIGSTVTWYLALS